MVRLLSPAPVDAMAPVSHASVPRNFVYMRNVMKLPGWHATWCPSPLQHRGLLYSLIRKSAKAVAGHCYSATAIRGQLARDMFQDFVEHLEGEILYLN